MKTATLARLAAPAVVAAAVAWQPAIAQETAPAAPPDAAVDVAVEDALLVVRVPNLQGTIDRMGALFSSAGTQMSAQTIRQQIGAPIGDPELAGMPAGSGFIFLFFGEGNSAGMLETTAEYIDRYEQAATTNANLMTARHNDSLLFSETEQGLATARALASAIEQTYLAGEDSDPVIELFADTHSLMETYRSDIDGFINMSIEMSAVGQTSPTANPETTRASTELSMKLMRAIADDTRSVQLTLDFDPKGVVLRKHVEAVEGSDLRNLLSANAGTPADLLGEVSRQGAFTGALALNQEAVGGLIHAKLAKLKDAGALSEMAATMGDDFTQMTTAYMPEMAFDWLMPGGNFMSGEWVGRIENKEQTVANMHEAMKYMDSPVATSGFEQMGFKLSTNFQDVEEDYKGMDVYAMTFETSMLESATEQQRNSAAVQQVMSAYDQEYQIAFGDEYAAGADSREKMQTLVDALMTEGPRTPTPIAAQEFFGDSGQMYMDVSLPGYLNGIQPFVAANQPQEAMNPLPMISGMLQGTPPISLYGEWGDGNMDGAMLVPQGLLARVIGIGQGFGAMMGAPQQGGMQ